MEQSIPIEQREIRGITARQLIWLMSGICTVLIAVLTTYLSLVNKLSNNQNDIVQMKQYQITNDLQIKTINMQLQTLEIRIVKLETESTKENK
jgi:hypothetical protein